MAKDGDKTKNSTDKNPAHQTGEEKGRIQRSGDVPKGTDTQRGSEGDRRRASKGAR